MEEIDVNDVFTPYCMVPSGEEDVPTGLCLVFNNIHFIQADFSDRTGSEKDYRRIEKVFRCFGFEVEEKRDCTCADMMDCLKRTAQTYNKCYCAFVCFFLSHGREEMVCDGHGRPVPLGELVSMFVDYCPQMTGKPKLFFAQICRQTEGETGKAAVVAATVEPLCRHDVSSNTAGISIFPPDKDILLGFATTPGRVAYRFCQSGSPYIEQLTLVLRKRGHQMTLCEALTLTGRRVEVEVQVGDENIEMCPSYISTLTRPLTFSLRRPDLRATQEAEDGEENMPRAEDLGLKFI